MSVRHLDRESLPPPPLVEVRPEPGHDASGAPAFLTLHRAALRARFPDGSASEPFVYDVADRRLAEARFMAGEDYTIADIALYPWLRLFHLGEAYDGGARFLDFASYRNIARWCEEIGARVPVQRGLKVNRHAEGFAAERHSAADIDAVM